MFEKSTIINYLNQLVRKGFFHLVFARVLFDFKIHDRAVKNAIYVTMPKPNTFSLAEKVSIHRIV